MKKSITKFAVAASLALTAMTPSFGQTTVGASCGCPPVGSRTNIVNLSTLADVNGNLTATNTVLTCDNMYKLDNQIYVGAGKTLTIMPGTVIKGIPTGNPLTANVLVVSRDGKINAAGTQDCPIIFTADADPLNGTYPLSNRGIWGGVVVLGKAKNNLITTNVYSASTAFDGLGFVEGIAGTDPRNVYGATPGNEVNNDNSGVLSYVSIRHAGATIGANNELNGLTLASVGNGTKVDHIEVIANDDDGIEFFGGTCDIKYATVFCNNDDAFDYDLGWNGRAQFIYVLKTDAATYSGGDNGIEADGDDDKKNPSYMSHPFIYNATFIGNGSNATPTLGSGAFGINAKERTEGEIYNSIFANYRSGLNLVKSMGTRPGTVEAYHNWIAGSLKVNNCTFVNNTAMLTVGGSAANVLASDSAKFFADGNVNAASVPGFDFTLAFNGTTNAVSDKVDPTPNPALASSITPPADMFFANVNYRGAFASDGSKSWLSDWANASAIGATAGLASCPTDVNGDGITNNADFLQLVSKFNQTCN
jgi:hypothetical protein